MRVGATVSASGKVVPSPLEASSSSPPEKQQTRSYSPLHHSTAASDRSIISQQSSLSQQQSNNLNASKVRSQLSKLTRNSSVLAMQNDYFGGGGVENGKPGWINPNSPYKVVFSHSNASDITVLFLIYPPPPSTLSYEERSWRCTLCEISGCHDETQRKNVVEENY